MSEDQEHLPQRCEYCHLTKSFPLKQWALILYLGHCNVKGRH